MRKKLSKIGLFVGAWVAIAGLGTAGCQDTPSGGGKAKATPGKAAMSAGGGAHLGKAFTVKEVTALEDILKNPKGFEGKTLRVEGVVTAHCHHKLAWFALRKTAKATQALRVMTKPAFLVPKDVKHGLTKASAEGVVELRTVPEDHAKHLAREHGLFGGEPDKIKGPQYIVSLRASGASFL